MPRESALDRRIVALVCGRGGWATKLHGGPEKRGLPDIIGCYRGIFLGIEDKVWPNRPTALQVYYLQKIADAGGVALVVYRIGIVRDVLERIRIDADAKGETVRVLDRSEAASPMLAALPDHPGTIYQNKYPT